MSDETKASATFAAHFYEVRSLEVARQLTVTGETGMSSDERWALETPWITASIAQYLQPGPDMKVVDYGCGVGRFAKELIGGFGCSVWGIDASSSMRRFALEFVNSPFFCTWAPQQLDQEIKSGFRADACISIWVMQHAFDAQDIIERIFRVLRPGGMLYALNMTARCVPTNVGYVSDGFDVQAALRRQFIEERAFQPPASIMPPKLAELTLIQVLRKPHDNHS